MLLVLLMTGEFNGGGMIVVFFIGVTQFFLRYLPKIKEMPRTPKNIAIHWFALPMLWTVVMSMIVGLIHYLVEDVIRPLLG